ncbi:MAG: hypothetical protein J1F11_13005 [Oscillospiraceae bacterium]|nr:hypothetical protein [Oscillospiraceae bacterium]
MKIYTIIGGVNGVGKSSLTGVLAAESNEVRFYDNENGFVKTAEYKNGELTVKNENAPGWVRKLKKYIKK